jgi:hypothetical protein
MQLPVIPKPDTALRFSQVLAIESNIATVIGDLDDIDALNELHAQAAALASWLKGKELEGPMLGAQRRIEARIGQLMGRAKPGNPHGNLTRESSYLNEADRYRFRILARGFGLLKDEEWRRS